MLLSSLIMGSLTTHLLSMNVNFTRLFFIIVALACGVLGLLIKIADHYLPVFITRSYFYGKFAVKKEHALVARLEVPKKWYKHFYIFAAPASTYTLFVAISLYVYRNPVPTFLHTILDVQLGHRRSPLVSPESALLALILMTAHCWKRLYETQRISVFSDVKMNIAHYFLGLVHYLGALTCIIGESAGFVEGSIFAFDWNRITTLQYACAVIFIAVSYEQLETNRILANLRKDRSGNVVTKTYKVPRGRLFEIISAPLQFTEIIAYSMLSVILWRSSTFHYVTLWVLVNQSETAILTHDWALKTFPDYPKHRKAFVPFLM